MASKQVRICDRCKVESTAPRFAINEVKAEIRLYKNNQGEYIIHAKKEEWCDACFAALVEPKIQNYRMRSHVLPIETFLSALPNAEKPVNNAG